MAVSGGCCGGYIYELRGGVLTVTALTTAPVSGDTFAIT